MHPGHNLMPKAVRAKLPPLYANEEKGEDAVAQVKYFTPDSSWTWYITEYDGVDTMFGLVDGLEPELGYISLSELAAAKGPRGLPIERDLHWKPKTIREIREEIV